MSKKLPTFRYKDYEAVIPLSLIDQNEGQIPDVPSNPRFVRDEKFDALVRSIEEDPEMLYLNEIKVYPMDGRYVAIGGNQRTKALLFLNIDEIKCKVLDPASPADRIRRIINKDNYGYGENDQKILHDEWADFMDEFEEMGMEDIFMDDIEDEEVEDIEVPQPIKEDNFDETKAKKRPIFARTGDIWHLGRHKVLCGDSTDPANYYLLTKGVKADLSFTSPPYNASCINQEGNERTKPKYDNYEDNKSPEEYLDFLKRSVGVLLENSEEVFYNIGLVSGNKKEIFLLINHYIDHFKDMIYWEKNNVAPMIQEGVVNNLVEFIIAFGNNNTRKFKNAQFKQGTYWNVIKGGSAGKNEYSDVHKATFPLFLPEEIIKNFTPRGGTVIDSFGGTGTTLIAAENLDRTAYLLELSEQYTSIIIDRYIKMKGSFDDVFLEGDGGVEVPFAEVIAERGVEYSYDLL